jgi:hypothetical protein
VAPTPSNIGLSGNTIGQRGIVLESQIGGVNVGPRECTVRTSDMRVQDTVDERVLIIPFAGCCSVVVAVTVAPSSGYIVGGVQLQ